MLWRSGYQTAIAEDVPLPGSLEQGNYIGVYVTEGLKDAEIWRRMIADHHLLSNILLLGKDWTPDQVAAAFPRSVLPLVVCIEEPELWKAYDRLKRTFAFVAQDGRAKVVMWGPPTEEAWDEFAAKAAIHPS